MRDLTIPYTRLNGDAFWNSIAMQYMHPVGRYYHNMEHVVDLYKYAKELGIEYDINLDVAILIHDVIYDGEKQVEIRSILHFINMVRNVLKQPNLTEIPEKVMMPFGVIEPNIISDLVITTIDHNPKKGGDNRLILLDLYSFTKGPTVCQENYYALIDELGKLYPNTNKEEILNNMGNNLVRIATNVVNYYVANEDDVYYDQWVAIAKGMETQINFIKQELVKERKRK